MGNGIAHVCALGGYDVLLNDADAVSHRRRDQGPHHQEHDAPSSRSVIKQADMDAALKRIKGAPTSCRHSRRAISSSNRSSSRTKPRRKCSPICAAVLRPTHDPGVEHVFDLDHAPRGDHRSPRQVHRRSLHEPGAGDGAGRNDPRPRDEPRDLRPHVAFVRIASARTSPTPKTSRPSSSTACWCR